MVTPINSVGISDCRNFEEIYKAHERRLRAFFQNCLGNRDDVEESIQETFCKYIHRVREGKQEEIHNVGYYLMKAAASVRNDKLAERRKHAALSYDEEKNENLVGQLADERSTVGGSERQLEHDEVSRMLPELFEKLTANFTERQERLVRMHVLEGMPIKEMAAALNENIKIVRHDTYAAQSRFYQQTRRYIKLSGGRLQRRYRVM